MKGWLPDRAKERKVEWATVMLHRYPQQTGIEYDSVMRCILVMDQRDSYELFESRAHENVLIVFNIGLLRQKKRKVESAYIVELRLDTISNLTFISMTSQAIRTEKCHTKST